VRGGSQRRGFIHVQGEKKPEKGQCHAAAKRENRGPGSLVQHGAEKKTTKGTELPLSGLGVNGKGTRGEKAKKAPIEGENRKKRLGKRVIPRTP